MKMLRRLVQLTASDRDALRTYGVLFTGLLTKPVSCPPQSALGKRCSRPRTPATIIPNLRIRGTTFQGSFDIISDDRTHITETIRTLASRTLCRRSPTPTMPVTLVTADNGSRIWNGRRTKSRIVKTSTELCQTRDNLDWRTCKRVIQSSLSQSDFGWKGSQNLSSKNGFVYAVFDAHSYHHYLTIRPEDA